MKTHLEYFYHWEQSTPEAPFLRQPMGHRWTTITYGEAGQAIRKMASALQHMGLAPGSHIGILSKNCYHWVLADLAIALGGYVSVPLYSTLKARELQQVIALADMAALFVGKLDEWEAKSLGIPNELPLIRFPHYPGNASVSRGQDWEELLAKSSPMAGAPVPALDQLWTIIYTSGTTGVPKGVMHTFGNIACLLDIEKKYDCYGSSLVKKSRHLSYLPLNHVADRFALMALIFAGGCISFVEKLESFARNLQDTQPTIFLAVPRIWIKFQMAVFQKIPPGTLTLLLKLPLMKQRIKSRIRQSLGLGSVIRAYTSTAITPESLKRWYEQLGITLLETYGMTETLGPLTLMPVDQIRMDTVGRPLPKAQCQLDGITGEILLKAPWLMKGYYKDEALTKKTLRDGWLHSGDKGKIDADGHLRVLGRINETFKTTKGKFIVPNRIEQYFASDPSIEQVCITGLGLSQPMALVVLSEGAKKQDPVQLRRVFTQKLEDINRQLHNYEKISHLVLLDTPWTDQNGMLTPTMKMKRNVIYQHYQSHLAQWAGSVDRVILSSG